MKSTSFSDVLSSLEKMKEAVKQLEKTYGSKEIAAFVEALGKSNGKKRKSKRGGTRQVASKYTEESRKALDTALSKKIDTDKLETANAISKSSKLTMKVAADLLKNKSLPKSALSKTIVAAAKWAGFKDLKEVKETAKTKVAAK